MIKIDWRPVTEITPEMQKEMKKTDPYDSQWYFVKLAEPEYESDIGVGIYRNKDKNPECIFSGERGFYGITTGQGGYCDDPVWRELNVTHFAPFVIHAHKRN